MKAYLKSIALVGSLFALLTAGTFATSQPERTIEITRASAKSFCLNEAFGRFAIFCRSFARRV